MRQPSINMKSKTEELSVIQKTHDLIQWMVPMINKLPRDHKFTLGDRITSNLYLLLETLLKARYSSEKKDELKQANLCLDIQREQLKILMGFNLIDSRRFLHASELINHVGVEIGGWLRQQKS